TSVHSGLTNYILLRWCGAHTTAAPPYPSPYASICMWLGLLSFLHASQLDLHCGLESTCIMNAYLQRADDFIQQQIYKYEQKLQGRDYAQMNGSQPQGQSGRRAQTFNTIPAQGPPAPKGWSQEFDHRSQRWYYREYSTGRSQWEPPSMLQHRRGHSQTFSEHHRPQEYSSRDQEMAERMQAEEYSRGRSSTQSSKPQSGHLSVPQPPPQQQRPTSASPHPSVSGQLPPGSYYDTRTGRVVTNMFPPDHPMNAH
ncbi:hypothetical protein DE146DRAFT_603414, partial [Phaeosphaeria sp. MPI-PUGE-AT-0046c]